MSGWTWEAVALQYTRLVSEGNAAPLGQDPFARVHSAQPSASWRGRAVRLLSGHAGELSARGMPPWMQRGGSYALFVDVDIQVWLSIQGSSKAGIHSAVRWLSRHSGSC